MSLMVEWRKSARGQWEKIVWNTTEKRSNEIEINSGIRA